MIPNDPKDDQKMAQNDVNGQIDKCFVELAIKKHYGNRNWQNLEFLGFFFWLMNFEFFFWTFQSCNFTIFFTFEIFILKFPEKIFKNNSKINGLMENSKKKNKQNRKTNKQNKKTISKNIDFQKKKTSTCRSLARPSRWILTKFLKNNKKRKWFHDFFDDKIPVRKKSLSG